jgi:hypothetical protein
MLMSDTRKVPLSSLKSIAQALQHSIFVPSSELSRFDRQNQLFCLRARLSTNSYSKMANIPSIKLNDGMEIPQVGGCPLKSLVVNTDRVQVGLWHRHYMV